MRVQAAKLDQVRRGRDGRMVLIDADVGGVVAELARIDSHLKVRFAESGNPPFFAVYWESDDQRDTYLVLTARAHQNRAGVWEGLDQRVVERIREIDSEGRSGYDYAAEIQRQNERAEQAKRQRVRESAEAHGEELAYALRKDLALDKHRVFLPRGLSS